MGIRESVSNFAINMNYTITAPRQIIGEINLPASKSISNRALIVNALSGNRCEMKNVARCDDTDAMVAALANDGERIDIGAAGTAMRFLTAYFSIQRGRTVTLDGTARMRQRPIKPLVDALNACGADIGYATSEGFPPITIHGRDYRCPHITIDASMSSQFISALLMISPAIGCSQVTLRGNVISRPYIDMTLGVMRHFGIQSQFSGNTITLTGNGGYTPPASYLVENDWSAASYWFALQSLLPGSRISLRGLFHDSLQGDARVSEFFIPLGVGTCSCGTYADLRNIPADDAQTTLHIDLSGNPDLAQTIVVTACLLGRHFYITGLQTLKIKETDRIEALRSQLRKLGYVITVADDCSLSWNGETAQADAHPVIETFDDHRMAMAFAPASTRFPGLTIADVEVVSKSYPDFWQHLADCGFILRKE